MQLQCCGWHCPNPLYALVLDGWFKKVAHGDLPGGLQIMQPHWCCCQVCSWHSWAGPSSSEAQHLLRHLTQHLPTREGLCHPGKLALPQDQGGQSWQHGTACPSVCPCVWCRLGAASTSACAWCEHDAPPAPSLQDRTLALPCSSPRPGRAHQVPLSSPAPHPGWLRTALPRCRGRGSDPRPVLSHPTSTP